MRIPLVLLLAVLVALASCGRRPAIGKTPGANRGEPIAKADAPPEQLAGPAQPPGNPAELGLWEKSSKLSRGGGPPLPAVSVETLGPQAILAGAPYTTVECSEKPFAFLFSSGECKEQIDQGGGRCVIEKSNDEGRSKSKEVRTMVGNYRTSLHIDSMFTRVYDFAPDKPQIEEFSIDYRYIGPCKPGMSKGDTFFVKQNGEWVTEKQLEEEARQRMQQQENRRR